MLTLVGFGVGDSCGSVGATTGLEAAKTLLAGIRNVFVVVVETMLFGICPFTVGLLFCLLFWCFSVVL